MDIDVDMNVDCGWEKGGVKFCIKKEEKVEKKGLCLTLSLFPHLLAFSISSISISLPTYTYQYNENSSLPKKRPKTKKARSFVFLNYN